MSRVTRSSSAGHDSIEAGASNDLPDTSSPSGDPVLSEIASGLFHLRRAWARPVIARMRRQSTGGRPLQLSNLMVVYAVAGTSARPEGPRPGPPPLHGLHVADRLPGTDGEHAAGTDADRAAGTDGDDTAGTDADHAAGTDGDRDAGVRGLYAQEVTVGDVAERLEIDPSTASRLVGHAIDAGLVSRRPSPLDARRADLRLTEAGRRVKQVADRYRQRYLAALLADWSGAERAEFARLLTRFTESAARRPMDLEGVGRIFEEALASVPETPGAPGPETPPGEVAAVPGSGHHHQGGR